MKPRRPLAEVFGFPATDMSTSAMVDRTNAFARSTIKFRTAQRTKLKIRWAYAACFMMMKLSSLAQSVFANMADCRRRCGFLFSGRCDLATLTEVRLKDADGGSAGNIDIVLCAYDKAGKVYDFGALEVQAVYISGNVRNPFEHYMEARQTRRHGLDDGGKLSQARLFVIISQAPCATTDFQRWHHQRLEQKDGSGSQQRFFRDLAETAGGFKSGSGHCLADL